MGKMVDVRYIIGAAVGLLAVTAGAQRLSGQATNGQRQPVKTYFDVISKLPWDPNTHGALIAPCPMAVAKGDTLSDLRLKKVHVGQILAIVPEKMTTLNSHFTEAPNLYDGLPREAKVLYLLTLLGEDQWSKITGDGLSIGDCRGPQVAVMQSILPNPFTYTLGTILGHNSVTYGNVESPIPLSESERSGIKLRVIRHLELELPLENNGGYTGTSVRDNRKIGDKIPMLHENDGDEYGQHIKIESENLPKKSQLDLRDTRFDTKISMKPGEKLGDLVGRIASATGINVVADPHYVYMQMVEIGTEASARDLIQAISFGVAGTYRKLGDYYILTCDLEGVAAHQARITAFEDDLEQLVRERENLWRGVLAKGTQLKKIKFNPGAYDKLSPAELANLEANDAPGYNNSHYIDPANASDAVRQELRDFNSGNTRLDPTKVGIHSSTRYELVLPDGSTSWEVGWLGNGQEFMPEPYQWQPPKPAPVTLPIKTSAKLSAVVLSADSIPMAKLQVQRAHQLGLSEVWLQTWTPDVLKAGIEAATPLAIKVKAAVRPWAVGPYDSILDPDCTAAGDHGAVLAEKKQNYEGFQHHWQEMKAYEPPTLDSLSPLDSQVSERWDRLHSLASIQGLSGVAILDAYPIGYAKAISYSYGSPFYTPATDAFLSYGYSEAQRLAFFKTEHVDPLDFEDETARTKASIREAWGMAYGGGQEFEKWQKAKGVWIHDALFKLTADLASLGQPIWISGQPIKIHIPPYGKDLLVNWKQGDDLPTGPEDYAGDEAAKLADLTVIPIQDDTDPDLRNRVADTVVQLLHKSTKPVVLDFSNVPPKKLDVVLKRWLTE